MKPSYVQVKEKLEQMMAAGELPVGAKLPSEPEMAHTFGVSRETLRTALKKLEEEGKLRCRNGVGRFVIQPLQPIPSPLDRLTSTSEMIYNAGLTETEAYESVTEDVCTEEWAKFLGIAAGEDVVVIERLRMANGEPVCLNRNILPYRLVGTAFKEQELKGSLMEFLERECGVRLVQATTEVVVPTAKDHHAKKLRTTPDSTVLLLKQIHYDEDHRPILFSYDYFRNDVFTFWISRTR